MSPKYEEDLSSALGAICEVLTRENHLLFVGREKPRTILFKGMITMISIAIDGPSGAGKSSLAKALAKDLGLSLIHIYDIRDDLRGQSLPAALAAQVIPYVMLGVGVLTFCTRCV